MVDECQSAVGSSECFASSVDDSASCGEGEETVAFRALRRCRFSSALRFFSTARCCFANVFLFLAMLGSLVSCDVMVGFNRPSHDDISH